MSSNLVTVAQFDDSANANLMLGLLKAAEIDAVLTNETMVGMAWHLSTAVGSICLQVREEDNDRARKVLEDNQQFDLDPEIPDGFFEEYELDNPQDQAREELVRRAFVSGVISLAIIPLIFYSMVLTGRAFVAPGQLRPWSKVKLAFSAMLGPGVIISAIMIFSSLAVSQS